eukprot:jgi/Ulvmu1/12677/UM094_0034.1
MPFSCLEDAPIGVHPLERRVAIAKPGLDRPRTRLQFRLPPQGGTEQRELAFASLIAHTNDSSRRQAECTKRLFHHISSGRENMTEQDVKKFAQSNGLPVDYVKPFFASLASYSRLRESSSTAVPYEVFHRYVTARESALKRIFDKLDTNRDGKLTQAEMRAGLAHMRVVCPNTRCCYRTNAATCAAATDVRVVGPKDSVDFCAFRKFFLLLPQDKMLVDYWLRASHPSCCDVGVAVSYPDPQRKAHSSPWGHLLAGGLAGAASRTVTAPLETLRIMAMTGSLAPHLPPAAAEAAVTSGAQRGGLGVAQLWSAGAGIMRKQGWQALFRGNGANVARSAPQKALDFFVFDALKECLSTRPAGAPLGSHRGLRGGASGPAGGKELGTVQTLTAAGLAGAVSSTVLYPLEVVRTRLSADSTGVYRGMGHTFRTIIRLEGPMALYRGLAPSVAAILPEAAITYGLFDLLKRSYVAYSGAEAGVLPSLAAGVLAAFTGQVVAYPLETVSRRMQVSHTATSAVDAFRGVIAEGGPGALFRGLGATTLRVVPMAIVSFGTYEWVRGQYTRMEEARELRAAQQELRCLPTSAVSCGA